MATRRRKRCESPQMPESTVTLMGKGLATPSPQSKEGCMHLTAKRDHSRHLAVFKGCEHLTGKIDHSENSAVFTILRLDLKMCPLKE